MFEGTGVRHSQAPGVGGGEFVPGRGPDLRALCCRMPLGEICNNWASNCHVLFPSLALSPYRENGSPCGGFSVSPSHLWEEELWWNGY